MVVAMPSLSLFACPLLRAGLVKDVVEQFPEAVVCGSKVCLQFLSNLIHTPFKSQAVKGGDKVGWGPAGDAAVERTGRCQTACPPLPFRPLCSTSFQSFWLQHSPCFTRVTLCMVKGLF